MSYRMKPDGECWNGGMFCVPKTIADNGLRFASGNQLKALLFLLANAGVAEPAQVATAVGCSEAEAAECLDYWLYEGVLTKDGAASAFVPQTADEPVTETQKAYENLPMPSHGPSDIVNLCADNPELADLLRSAESVLASSLSIAFKSNLINMVTYYGLPTSVVLTLLEYYKAQRDEGRNVTTRTLQNIAKSWAEEEVSTIEQASLKLLEMTEVERLWLKVLELCGFEYKQISAVQRKMLLRWRKDFDNEMIYFACNTMKKYTDEDKQSINAIDNILKGWKRKGFKTPDEVKNQPKAENKPEKKGKLKSKPSFDIEEIKRRSALNDDFDV